jgi:hypothetical protein
MGNQNGGMHWSLGETPANERFKKYTISQLRECRLERKNFEETKDEKHKKEARHQTCTEINRNMHGLCVDNVGDRCECMTPSENKFFSCLPDGCLGIDRKPEIVQMTPRRGSSHSWAVKAPHIESRTNGDKQNQNEADGLFTARLRQQIAMQQERWWVQNNESTTSEDPFEGSPYFKGDSNDILMEV